MSEEAIKIFYSYSRKDLDLRNRLDNHLAALRKANRISTWHDLQLEAGTEWEPAILHKLDTADIILLLISSDFIDSEYCYGTELKRAIARHDAGTARVIPIILRPCDWNHSYVPFSKLNVLPTHATPITKWEDRDEAFAIVARHIRETVEQLNAKKLAEQQAAEDKRQQHTAQKEVEQRTERKRVQQEQQLQAEGQEWQRQVEDFIQKLREGYHCTYRGWKSDYEGIIASMAWMAMETIARSNAPSHDVEHSMLVTLVGQEILKGRHMQEGGVSCEDWLHFIMSLVYHDIGYVKGVCRHDRDGLYATGRDNSLLSLSPWDSDVALSPYHVDRAKLFIDERFGGHKLIDAEVIKRNIELTRFPVPAAEDYQDTVYYPGLIRASCLIGQFSGSCYLEKIGALFDEFEKTGVNKALGYHHSSELRKNYPKFYWHKVCPYIQDALHYLCLTQQGRQIKANLDSNVSIVEHEKSEE